MSYLGPSQAPNLGTETNLKLSTYTGHLANTYTHTRYNTRHKDKAYRQGTKTRHTEPGTQNKANGVHTSRPKTLLLTSGECFT